jgi:hypothetical protein
MINEIKKIMAEKEEIRNGILLPATSILPKLLPYRRLKKFAIFAAVGSLESVGKQQLRQYAKRCMQANFAAHSVYFLVFSVENFSF